jgi:DNA-binding IclR family transcriptional regulator
MSRFNASALDRLAEMTKLLIERPRRSDELVELMDCYPDAVRRYARALESKGLMRRQFEGRAYVFVWIGGVK